MASLSFLGGHSYTMAWGPRGSLISLLFFFFSPFGGSVAAFAILGFALVALRHWLATGGGRRRKQNSAPFSSTQSTNKRKNGAEGGEGFQQEQLSSTINPLHASSSSSSLKSPKSPKRNPQNSPLHGSISSADLISLGPAAVTDPGSPGGRGRKKSAQNSPLISSRSY